MFERNGKLKICLVSSSGGHLNQLLKLSDSWAEQESFYITTSEVVRDKLKNTGPVYVVGECNREHPVKVLRVLFSCISIMIRERPDVVISTGAAAGCIGCFLGKLMGAKVIWVDSITNVEHISMSGAMVRYIADVFFVQWPELARKYKNVKFYGALI